MNALTGSTEGGRPALASLRRYVRQPAPREACDLCSLALADEHAHLVDPANGRMMCACDPCAILFGAGDSAKFRRVPRDVRFLADFQLSDLCWEALQLPINLAFFLHSSRAGRVVAFYPSPAGATEAVVGADAWEMLVEDNPSLRTVEPDVEALLVNRTGSPCESYRVGVDQCYKLVGLIRSHWRGMSGGTEVWREIKNFFDGLKNRSRSGGFSHA
jgi:hypothetical protein